MSHVRTLARPFLASLVVFALALPAAAELRIGYFDVKQILEELDEAKSAKAMLKKEFDAKQKQLDGMKNEIERLQRDFEQKAPILAQDAKEKMAIELQTKAAQAQRLYYELQQDLAQKEQQELGRLLSRLEPVVRELADAEGYTFVFEKNESGLFYGASAHDLTSQIIRRYNKAFPAAKAAGSKAPAKGKK